MDGPGRDPRLTTPTVPHLIGCGPARSFHRPPLQDVDPCSSRAGCRRDQSGSGPPGNTRPPTRAGRPVESVPQQATAGPGPPTVRWQTRWQTGPLSGGREREVHIGQCLRCLPQSTAGLGVSRGRGQSYGPYEPASWNVRRSGVMTCRRNWPSASGSIRTTRCIRNSPPGWHSQPLTPFCDGGAAAREPRSPSNSSTAPLPCSRRHWTGWSFPLLRGDPMGAGPTHQSP